MKKNLAIFLANMFIYFYFIIFSGARSFLRTNARPYPSPNVQLIGKNGAPRLQIAPQLKPSPARRLKKTCVSRIWTRPAQCPHSMSAGR